MISEKLEKVRKKVLEVKEIVISNFSLGVRKKNIGGGPPEGEVRDRRRRAERRGQAAGDPEGLLRQHRRARSD